MPNPNFIIIGASRSGTTSLAKYLGQNSKIYVPAIKEVHFFDFKFGKGIEWYRRKFRDGMINGEASPFYLPCVPVAKRVKDTLPNVKIIAMLRNPTDRAYSHYWFNKVINEESKPFLDAVKAEEERLLGKAVDSAEWRRWSYLARGRYAEQLERWKVFNITVLKSETFYERPQLAMLHICQKLGVGREPFTPKIHQNQDYPPMGARARAWCDQYFKPHNERLAKEWCIEWNFS